MGLLETLLIGSFMYTSALWRWTYKKFEQITGNHLKNLEARVKALEGKK